MIELFSEEPIADALSYKKAFAGDTLNTMFMASKLGSSCGYITRLAHDPFSDYLLSEWNEQGIDVSTVKRVHGFTGVHFIAQMDNGERDFLYYRNGSAAGTMVPKDLNTEYIGSARILHISAILQAVSKTCKDTLLAAVQMASELGVLVSYDTNLRLNLTSASQALEAMVEILPYVDLVMPSFPEETMNLTGQNSERDTVKFFQNHGVKNVVLKKGASGVLIATTEKWQTIPGLAPRGVVDTTGAGDAFAGGLLHRLGYGDDIFEAAQWGVAAASLKIGGRGAIVSQPSRAQVTKLLPSIHILPA